ncbi:MULTISPECIES: ABC transporter ATP-binding protein [Marinomonas]|uniref:ATP-binding cassette domain-containing protein n=1 Tax=Marinomonas arctica TaxID=383750 RepID=A0A7H1J6R5_9GAMM|nr:MULTISPECIES: ATP-binding cassette domain-containing protein [Marinomonas]MCS7485155.1 iron-hydroxamate transporter ATP-binding subunit [Marinomonas sp. BSi20414]QNT06181.1 ATP-binding cassette domain-containing protein [Marinomonas arctica]GGN18188.1 iron-hydroxamate transporter ATP-binding protein [Marinomonas arctica]
MIESKELGLNVDGRALLANFSMTFEPGKIYALIGHNGSGKSTLLKLLAQQQKPTQGRILLNDQAIESWSPKKFAQQVAYLPQQTPATDSLSGRDLVSFGRYPWHGLLGRLNKQDHQYIDDAMALTNTKDYADRLVDTLSGGERQRLWLAMLLAQRSQYVLLDEPLSALDIAHQVDMLNLIKKLSQELNLGVIIVIHDINMAARFCDHIVALHSGKMIASGSVDELFTPQTLEDIYGVNMHITDHPAGYPVAMPY